MKPAARDFFNVPRTLAGPEMLLVQVGTLERTQAETAAELDALLPSIFDKALKEER